MKNERCYIAGKISGLTKEQAALSFMVGKQQVEQLGYEPVSPLDLPHQHGQTWEEYMKEDLSELLKCQHVYALNSWIDSRGAKIELSMALELGINVIYQPTPIENLAEGVKAQVVTAKQIMEKDFHWDQEF